MAKDDYFVLAYRILQYLYRCLKSGNSASHDALKPDALGVNARYGSYLLEHLAGDGYLSGVYVDEQTVCMGDVQITPRGIEYLMDGRMMKRAARFLRSARAVIPEV